jgi:glutaredoxin 3
MASMQCGLLLGLVMGIGSTAHTAAGIGQVNTSPSRPSPDNTIRLTRELVSLDVSVQDGEGRFVPGIDRARFKVFEDGVRQPIDFFGATDAPVSIGIVYDFSGSDAVELVWAVACPSCDVEVLDMRRDDVAARAKALGIRSVPAVVVDGTPADCCSGRGVDEEALGRAGLGAPLT